MSSPARRSLLLLILGLALRPESFVAAQEPPRFSGDFPLLGNPLESKDLARAKFEASQADPRELAQARLEAARGMSEARFKEFLAGRGTLDILLASSRHWLESELAVCEREIDRVAALERHWERAKAIEDITTRLYFAGRVSIRDYVRPRYLRLEAEARLFQVQARTGKLAPPVGTMPGPFEYSEADPPGLKELAKAKFEARQADLRTLAQAKLDAARIDFESGFREFLAGRGSLCNSLRSSQRWLASELALATGDADRAAAFERHWEHTWRIEAINQRKYDEGRIAIPYLLLSRYDRLEAEIRFVEAQAKVPNRHVSLTGTLPELPELDDLFDTRRLAQAKVAALQADLREHARAKREAALGECAARQQESLACRGILDLMQDALHRWLESELALSTEAADRLAALERHWVLALRIEAVHRGRFDAGRIAIQDYLQTRYGRLDAELKWFQARTGQPGN